MGGLERHLDLDLIRRLRAGIRHPSKPAKRVKPIRAAATYRAARRNTVRAARARLLDLKRTGVQP